MDTPKFREDKAAAMAHRFLQLNDGSMSYMKLIKLMYIVERTAILRWGRSVTFDRFVSMPLGPVLSRTYDLIGEEPRPGIIRSPFHERVSSPVSYRVTARDAFLGPEPLSEAEFDLIAEVFSEYGAMDRFALSDLTHRFPEFDDPDGSSETISIRCILERNSKTEPQTNAILAELDALAYAERIFG